MNLEQKLIDKAQNEEMVDSYYTETGRMLLDAADAIKEFVSVLEKAIDKLDRKCGGPECSSCSVCYDLSNVLSKYRK